MAGSNITKKALVIVFSSLRHDARVTRQVEWLKKDFKVTVVCFYHDDPQVELIKLIQRKLTLWLKFKMALCLISHLYKQAYNLFHPYEYVVDELSNQNYDVIIANDIDTLPLAFLINKNKKSKIIFDAHEYAPRHFENRFIWRTFFQSFYMNLCKKYIPHVDGMLTVGQGLANEYEKTFGIKPLIITNATKYFDVSPVQVKDNKIRLIHHGIANASRKLELMLEMMKELDERFTLDLILMPSNYASESTKEYIKSLEQKAISNDRIKILPRVKSNEVVPTINQYDIGVFLLPPVNFNYANTLPNKLFDFIQGRLAIAIGPTPEMADIVNRFDIGVVSEDFTPQSLAAKLNALSTEQLTQFKNRASTAAAVLNAEQNEIIFLEYVQNVCRKTIA